MASQLSGLGAWSLGDFDIIYFPRPTLSLHTVMAGPAQ